MVDISFQPPSSSIQIAVANSLSDISLVKSPVKSTLLARRGNPDAVSAA